LGFIEKTAAGFLRENGMKQSIQQKRGHSPIAYLAAAVFIATIFIADAAYANCVWHVTGRIVRSEPVPTNDGMLMGPGYSVDVMTMARWSEGALCPGGDCPYNTANWLPNTTNGDGEFVIVSAPLPGPTCHAARDFVLMIQGEKANIASWQTVDNRNGIEGPGFPLPTPIYVHEVNLGDIKVDDLPPPEGLMASNDGGIDVGNAEMAPLPLPGEGSPSGLPTGTFAPAPLPGADDGEDLTEGLPTGTFAPTPLPGAGGGEDLTEGLPTGTFEPMPLPGNDDEEDEEDTVGNIPDGTLQPHFNPCPDFGALGIEQADFAFNQHPGAGDADQSLDGLIQIQQRHSGGTPMARRLSVTFEMANNGAEFSERSGDCPVEIQLRLNEGPNRNGSDVDGWHSVEEDMPNLQANWFRFITLSASLNGTGNDTSAEWDENYEYVLVQVILDHTNGVSEANEDDNVAGEYCYHAPGNTFVDMSVCDAAAAEFD